MKRKKRVGKENRGKENGGKVWDEFDCFYFERAKSRVALKKNGDSSK